jgi:serine phosphatase RsbU (regulator of sigma subunit)/anti-sigma regulatory factor (Ser/Thr protein kinase)
LLRRRLPASLESLGEFTTFVSARAGQHGFSLKRIKEIELAVEEALVNIFQHAYPEGGGQVEVRWRPASGGQGPAIEIEDNGQHFDVLAASEPDLKADLSGRKVGGLGIHFLKKMVAGATYRRESGKNILTLSLEAEPPEALLRDGDLALPLGAMRKETFRKGDVLFRAGDQADKMYYIARGCVKLTELNKTVKEGDIIGEMGILSPYQERTATAECEADLEAFTISREEVIRLFARDSALAFNLVHLCIKRFIENLRAETEAKERIQSELRIAHDIQVSMLPRKFPPFPDRKEFDIFAMMEPAKEVGGDFYDFFLINDRYLCVLVGDVSGKGVPAALFMAISKTLLKTEALRGLPPDEIFARVNRILIPDNDALLFVTAFLLILDLVSGEIRYANAGHPPPLISSGPASFDFLEAPPGMVLGAVEPAKFRMGRRTLAPGEAVVLYTDGVTEAMNAGQELFSEKRLKDHLDGLASGDPERVVHELRQAVKGFAQGTQSSDDITIVALKFKGAAEQRRFGWD